MKTKRLSLDELGREYEKHIELQDYFINKCKQEIERAKESGNRDVVCELKSKLLKFYEIKHELLQTADTLKNYYKGEK